ncbi:MAG: hypothetical protein QOC94_1228, partial [Actinoplanes sp.]|nr:hypothetical protein [Actinoplanes sp.]
RTTLRNYSPEADKFRRDHKRHRDWGLTQRHARRLRQIRGRLDSSRTPSTAGNPRPDRARHPSGPLGDGGWRPSSTRPERPSASGPPQPEQVDLTAPTPRPTRREQPRNTGPDQAGASSPSPARVHGTRVQATRPGQPDPAGQCQIDPRNTRQPRPVGQHHPQTAEIRHPQTVEIRHPQPAGRRHAAPSGTDRPVSTTSAAPDPPRRKHRYPGIADESQPGNPAGINSPATVTLLRRQEQHNERAPPRVHTKRPAAAWTECRAGEQSPGSRTHANEDRRLDEWSVDARLRALIGVRVHPFRWEARRVGVAGRGDGQPRFRAAGPSLL